MKVRDRQLKVLERCDAANRKLAEQQKDIFGNRPSDRFTLSTVSGGDSRNAYIVYFEREIVATFPINNPASPDAKEFARRFTNLMNRYYTRRIKSLVANV